MYGKAIKIILYKAIRFFYIFAKKTIYFPTEITWTDQKTTKN